MVCQCGGTGKGIKSKVGGELELSLQALFVENNIIRGEIAHSKTRDHTSM
jgi:hypothetical protein